MTDDTIDPDTLAALYLTHGTGPRSTQTNEAAVAERDNHGRVFPSRRLGRKGGR